MYKFKLLLLINLLIILNIKCTQNLPLWKLDDIKFKTRDGFTLNAYLLRPEIIKHKYPAVICFHQCWGNRDDFLKLFPFFAEAGIVAIAANYPRLTPTLDPKRYTDLIDTINYAESINYIDKEHLGIITASLSVNTGLLAIYKKENVIADVILSGPILDEKLRKWLTTNSNLAIFTMASLYDGNNHIFMKEYIARNLNPSSKYLFLNDISNRFSINAHGTFIFDEYPYSILLIQKFYMETFGIKKRNHGYIKKLLPQNTIVFPSTDSMPIVATFKKANNNNLGIILYPPRYQSRNYYDNYINILTEKNITILAPNTKRTCRSEDKLYLCEREILGAAYLLKNNHNIKKLIILFPSFYFLAAKDLAINNLIPNASFIFVETGDHNYGVNPKEIYTTNNKIYYLKHMNIDSIIKIVEKEI